MVAQCITTRPILDLCESSSWRMGARVSRWWWRQANIDLEGTNKMAAAEEVTDSELDSNSDGEELSGAIESSGEEWSVAEG